MVSINRGRTAVLPVSFYVILSLLLFVIGALGVIVRRNAIVVFMCIDLMLNAVNIAFAAFSQLNANLEGNIAILAVIVVAAAETAIGLAIVLALFRNFESVMTSDAGEMML